MYLHLRCSRNSQTVWHGDRKGASHAAARTVSTSEACRFYVCLDFDLCCSIKQQQLLQGNLIWYFVASFHNTHTHMLVTDKTLLQLQPRLEAVNLLTHKTHKTHAKQSIPTHGSCCLCSGCCCFCYSSSCFSWRCDFFTAYFPAASQKAMDFHLTLSHIIVVRRHSWVELSRDATRRDATRRVRVSKSKCECECEWVFADSHRECLRLIKRNIFSHAAATTTLESLPARSGIWQCHKTCHYSCPRPSAAGSQLRSHTTPPSPSSQPPPCPPL